MSYYYKLYFTLGNEWQSGKTANYDVIKIDTPKSSISHTEKKVKGILVYTTDRNGISCAVGEEMIVDIRNFLECAHRMNQADVFLLSI